METATLFKVYDRTRGLLMLEGWPNPSRARETMKHLQDDSSIYDIVVVDHHHDVLGVYEYGDTHPPTLDAYREHEDLARYFETSVQLEGLLRAGNTGDLDDSHFCTYRQVKSLLDRLTQLHQHTCVFVDGACPICRRPQREGE